MADVKCLHLSVPPALLPQTPPAASPDDSELVPAEFLCPLSGGIMRDPVIVPSGQSFDRDSIYHFLARGGRVCPKTGTLLAGCALIPNDALRSCIVAWCAAHMLLLSPPLTPPKSQSPPAASRAVLHVLSAPAAASNGVASPARLLSPCPSLERRHSLQSTRSGANRGGNRESFLASDAMNSAIPRHMTRTGSNRSLCRTISPLSERSDSSGACASPSVPLPSGAHPSNLHRQGQQLAATTDDEANEEALNAYLAVSVSSLSHRCLQRVNSPASARRRSQDAPVCEMRPLVDALSSPDVAVRRDAAEAVHVAMKETVENRMRLVHAGGVGPLLEAVGCEEQRTAEKASAALLYLSLAREAVREVVGAGGIHVLINVLRPAADTERRWEAAEATKANAAAALFTLVSTKEERKRIACSAGAVPHLVRLLREAETGRAHKDACLALYGLVSVQQAAEQAVALGVVPLTIALLERQGDGVEEKAASLLAAVARSPAGLEAILGEEDVVSILVEVLEGDSERAAGKAASTLLAMARHGGDAMAHKVLAEGCLPPLAKLAATSAVGSDSIALINLLRNVGQKR